MISRRETDAHKCTGTPGNVSGTKNLCQGQVSHRCFDEDGQYFSKSLHQSFRGDALPSAELNCSPTVQQQSISGKKNPVADKESRAVRDHCNWMIHPELFAQIHQEMGLLDLDLLASRLAYQLLCFYSQKPDPLGSHRCIHPGLESIPQL